MIALPAIIILMVVYFGMHASGNEETDDEWDFSQVSFFEDNQDLKDIWKVIEKDVMSTLVCVQQQYPELSAEVVEKISGRFLQLSQNPPTSTSSLFDKLYQQIEENLSWPVPTAQTYAAIKNNEDLPEIIIGSFPPPKVLSRMAKKDSERIEMALQSISKKFQACRVLLARLELVSWSK